MLAMTEAPYRYPDAELCRGLVERYFGRDRCASCRGCREWRDVVPLERRPLPPSGAPPA